MKLAMGCDHAAYTVKEELKKYLLEKGYQVTDLGTDNDQSCDYPVFAKKVCQVVSKEGILGILLCGTGIGMCMVANRYQGIRGAVCRTPEDAMMAKRHNNANVLCLGARVTPINLMKDIVTTWLETCFEEGRHSKRVAQFEKLGEEIK
jgi:ribose 5-phosphate isomerase B